MGTGNWGWLWMWVLCRWAGVVYMEWTGETLWSKVNSKYYITTHFGSSVEAVSSFNDSIYQ